MVNDFICEDCFTEDIIFPTWKDRTGFEIPLDDFALVGDAFCMTCMKIIFVESKANLEEIIKGGNG